MVKKHLQLITFISVFVIGLLILMNSINLGVREVERYFMKANVGTASYLLYLEQYITNFRYLGAILSILGGLGVVLKIQRIRQY